jgi:hypothetical protein
MGKEWEGGWTCVGEHEGDQSTTALEHQTKAGAGHLGAVVDAKALEMGAVGGEGIHVVVRDEWHLEKGELGMGH